MAFSVSGNVDAIAAAINEFSAKYHADYSRVRTEAMSYLSEAPSTGSAQRLAREVLQALRSWGAGKRGAPGCQSLEVATIALCDPALHQKLRMLADSINYLNLTGSARSLKANPAFSTVKEFDACMISTLHELAAGLLAGNTNVTYPMKALLLITGLMPAFDSQVRGGLSVAGVSGFSQAQYFLTTKESAGNKKICALPFFVADCVSRSKPLLDESIAASRYPALKGQYGRVFDVLLFVQATRTPETALIRFSAVQPRPAWYRI